VTAAFDLSAYSSRIGYRGAPRPDVETLYELHRAHIGAIPFENLDIQLGRPIRLDPESLQAKLVRGRRGGYCFEQNGLFALALGSIGFEFETCEARVRQGAQGAIRPRTHMVLRVHCGGRIWLTDVGFGGDGLLEPAPLDGTATTQAGVVYHVVAEGACRVLQRRLSGEWQDLYVVMPEPAHSIDFEVGNWFTSTHPNSAFVLNLTAQAVIGECRHVLRNLNYSISCGEEVRTREIGRAELLPLLRETFGLDLPDGSKFRALDPFWSPTT
jgi:N-hydroxyarylamine O-acetyltransferase